MSERLPVKALDDGDVVLDAMGQPYYRVLANLPAARHGYRVLFVEPLTRNAALAMPSKQTSAHGEDVRDVQRARPS